MKIDVYLRDTRTGYTNVYHENDDEPFVDYGWSEGNFSCDCNRSILLYPEDEEKELPCGNGTIVIDKIVRTDTGEILYTEKEEEKQNADI